MIEGRQSGDTGPQAISCSRSGQHDIGIGCCEFTRLGTNDHIVHLPPRETIGNAIERFKVEADSHVLTSRGEFCELQMHVRFRLWIGESRVTAVSKRIIDIELLITQSMGTGGGSLNQLQP